MYVRFSLRPMAQRFSAFCKRRRPFASLARLCAQVHIIVCAGCAYWNVLIKTPAYSQRCRQKQAARHRKTALSAVAAAMFFNIPACF